MTNGTFLLRMRSLKAISSFHLILPYIVIPQSCPTSWRGDYICIFTPSQRGEIAVKCLAQGPACYFSCQELPSHLMDITRETFRQTATRIIRSFARQLILATMSCDDEDTREHWPNVISERL